jgi:hypothetical protein
MLSSRTGFILPTHNFCVRVLCGGVVYWCCVPDMFELESDCISTT